MNSSKTLWNYSSKFNYSFWPFYIKTISDVVLGVEILGRAYNSVISMLEMIAYILDKKK